MSNSPLDDDLDFDSLMELLDKEPEPKEPVRPAPKITAESALKQTIKDAREDRTLPPPDPIPEVTLDPDPIPEVTLDPDPIPEVVMAAEPPQEDEFSFPDLGDFGEAFSIVEDEEPTPIAAPKVEAAEPLPEPTPSVELETEEGTRTPVEIARDKARAALSGAVIPTPMPPKRPAKRTVAPATAATEPLPVTPEPVKEELSAPEPLSPEPLSPECASIAFAGVKDLPNLATQRLAKIVNAVADVSKLIAMDGGTAKQVTIVGPYLVADLTAVPSEKLNGQVTIIIEDVVIQVTTSSHKTEASLVSELLQAIR